MVSATGKRFENKIRGWHKGGDCLTFKFPDYASTGSFNKAICDRVTITHSGVFWFECKHTENKTSFSLGLIKPHQWRSMLDIEKFTGKAFFLIEDGYHNVYMVPPTALFTLGLKSVKFHQIQRFLVEKKDFLSLF